MSGYDLESDDKSRMCGSVEPAFEHFVTAHTRPGALALDIGCGQGRDTLMLARHGYAVVAVDRSPAAIEHIIMKAAEEGISIDAKVADYFEFQPQGEFDIIVLDAVFHFDKESRENELALLNRLSNHLSETGYLCLFVTRTPATDSTVRLWLSSSNNLKVIVEQEMAPPETEDASQGDDCRMLMLVLQRFPVSQ
ncbi:class I SAM-dependent methyltransferase [Parasalinivibrio latis]|uniref:class I SAM-dependent methyltransferase n=1 Tax=Parasalinivibrio latis TaxID=2952610 RepID=UPI0030E2FECF